jgi:hypothetical protein
MVEENPASENKPNTGEEQISRTPTTSNKQPDITSDSGTDYREKKQRDCYDWITLSIAILGLFGLWYYAYWAKAQATANTDAANAAKASADAAIGANKAFMYPAFWTIERLGDQVRIDVSWANVGPTAALRLDATEKYVGLRITCRRSLNVQ